MRTYLLPNFVTQLFLSVGIFAFVMPFAAQAFNPNEGIEPAYNASARLPSTAPLISPMPRIHFPSVSSVAAPRVTPAENHVSIPEEKPASITHEANAVLTPSPQYPPVDAQTLAIAQQNIETPQSTAPGFIAPAPLVSTPEPLADTSTLTAPLPPLSIQPLPPSAPTPVIDETLSKSSKVIIGNIPSRLDAPKPSKGKVGIKRMSPEIQALTADLKPESYDSVGLSIKIQRSGLDTNYELNRAYNDLMGGQTSEALKVYQNILGTEPDNADALFGAGSVYQRTGDIERARTYYARLLKIDPNHREGLNNFLALISEEAPQEALAELERLEQRNPHFSPIPAQQAMVLKKLGYLDQARERMLRAIDLAPENLTYKYNLAILLDSQGHYTDASALYRLLIDASLKGETIPSTIEIIQKRLNYIASVNHSAMQVGS